MKRGTLWIVLGALCALVSAGCSHHHRVVNQIQVTITTSPSTLAASATGNVAATVVNDSANGGVTWNCTPSDFCSANNFNPTQTASVATSVFTAPTTAGTATITATSVTDKTVVSSPVNITITNGTVTASSFFSFYVTGEESNIDAGDPYVIAGSVGFGPDGLTVVSGEQDYNDADQITSPQPGGDVITGGHLVMGSDGNAMLTLFTNNLNVGNPAGTETFALAFANTNHAQIIQFDGSATSSGSYDLQTLPQTLSGSFSFVFSGAADTIGAVSSGGVFTITGGTSISGTVDTNEGGTVTPNTPFTATLTAPDSFGRGNISTSSDPEGFTGNYYIVGPEVIRIIDVDTTDLGVGSAYGQGSNSFTAASIGSSVFYINNSLEAYAAVGQFTTSSGTNFNGVGDFNLLNTGGNLSQTAQSLSGTYTMNPNGYGAMAFTEGFGDIVTFGIYAVDPTLNINDPNDTTDPTIGGALVAEMDSNLAGTGLLVPQTDTDASHFTGNYTFGAQGDTDADFDEFDFVGEATVAGSTFTGNGNLADPFGALTDVPNDFTDLTLSGTVTPDEMNPGRITFPPLTLASVQAGGSTGLNVTVYQAGPDQLFWIDTDPDDYFGGYLQQSTIASAATAAKKTSVKRK